MPFTFKNTPSYEMAGQFAQEAGRAEAMPKAIQLQQQQQQLDMSRQKAAADHQYRMARQFAEAREAQYRSAEQARQNAIKEKAAENKEYLDTVSKMKAELDPTKYTGEDSVEASKYGNDLRGILNDKILNSGVGSGARVRRAIRDLGQRIDDSRLFTKQTQPAAGDLVAKAGVMSLRKYNALLRVDAERSGEEYVQFAPSHDQDETYVSAMVRNGVRTIEIDTDDRKHKRDLEMEVLKGKVSAAGKAAEQQGLYVKAPPSDWKHQHSQEEVRDLKRETQKDIREELEKSKVALEKALEEGPAGEFRTHGAGFDLDEIDAALDKARNDHTTAQNIIDNPPTGDSVALSDANTLLDNSREKIGVLVARRKIAVVEEGMRDHNVARAALERLQAGKDAEIERSDKTARKETSKQASNAGQDRKQSVEGNSDEARSLAEAISGYQQHDDMFVLLDDLDEDDEDYFKVRLTFIGPDGRKKTKVVEPEAAVRFMSGVNEETGQTFYEEQVERRNAQLPVVPESLVEERQQLVEELRRMQTLWGQWEKDQLNEAGEQKMGLGARRQHLRRWALRNKIEETRRRIDEITPTR